MGLSTHSLLHKESIGKTMGFAQQSSKEYEAISITSVAVRGLALLSRKISYLKYTIYISFFRQSLIDEYRIVGDELIIPVKMTCIITKLVGGVTVSFSIVSSVEVNVQKRDGVVGLNRTAEGYPSACRLHTRIKTIVSLLFLMPEQQWHTPFCAVNALSSIGDRRIKHFTIQKLMGNAVPVCTETTP